MTGGFKPYDLLDSLKLTRIFSSPKEIKVLGTEIHAVK